MCSARKLPRCWSSRKKFTPKSASVTTAESWIVNRPTPGRTRFLSVSVPTTPGPLLMSRMCDFSSASCPVAPHNRSCRSYLQWLGAISRPLRVVNAYFFSLAVGPCTGGGRSAISSLQLWVCKCMSCVCAGAGVGSPAILPPPLTRPPSLDVGHEWGRRNGRRSSRRQGSDMFLTKYWRHPRT